MGFIEILSTIYYTLTSPALQDELLRPKITLILIGLFFLPFLIYFYFKSTYLHYLFIFDLVSFFDWQPPNLARIIKRWDKIKKRMESGSDYEFKLAIVEADNLLRDVLVEKGFAGKSFEERVGKLDSTQVKDIDEILEAHKIRNSIVYDPNFKITVDRIKKILAIYEKGIRGIESF
ncbi:MAG: hypothetical protein WC845_01035 [Candidatus Staskawiczbacteria bacterium]|jgi:hypothetical protein